MTPAGCSNPYFFEQSIGCAVVQVNCARIGVGTVSSELPMAHLTRNSLTKDAGAWRTKRMVSVGNATIRRLFPTEIAKNQRYYDKRQDGR
jgi:hypothetical protein